MGRENSTRLVPEVFLSENAALRGFVARDGPKMVRSQIVSLIKSEGELLLQTANTEVKKARRAGFEPATS